MNYLSDNNIPVAKPVKSLSGKYIETVNTSIGTYYAVVFTALHGKQFEIEDLDKFIPIIKKISAKPKIRGEALYYILEYLEKCLLVDPLTVFEMLEEMLVGEDFNKIADNIPASHSKAPLNIVNTILECYPKQEERALKALDKLIELKWVGVDDYLRAFDRL